MNRIQLLFLTVLTVVYSSVGFASIQSSNKGHFVEFFESTTGETVDVIAPVVLFENFNSDDATNLENTFVFNAVNSGALSIVAGINGQATMSVGVADDDDAEFSSQLIWQASGAAVVEARFKASETTCGFNFGFSDAQQESADNLAVEYSGTTLTSNSTDFAGFFFDSDATTDNLYAVSVDSDTDGTVVDSSTAIDTNWHIYQIRLSDDGTAEYWLDGSRIGSETTGISTDVPLCIYLGLIRRNATPETTPDLHIDYIRAWQTR